MLSNARGGIWTRTPFRGKGILSRSRTPNIRRQRGYSATAERTEAHTHPIPSYHGYYHGPTPSELLGTPKLVVHPSDLLYLGRRPLALAGGGTK